MILVDLNVLLDVIQRREPHYRASAAVLEEIVRRRVQGGLAAHELTTVHYLVRRYQDGPTADRAVDWLLRYFTILEVGQGELVRAQALGWQDFEDAVGPVGSPAARANQARPTL